ncbi:hypothetical protein Dvina_04230 [Dactylosporangium vinaceum]|uniref:BTAD domain-containing putative transcriptional regulator n=1 Tax=Dactylosporangium vinaceum TaxID=53362 RepID=A0ABV5M0E0_9ACTN|nr:BTAD domain-containing putative transcriptional regulator [Dactylosporangium vinaceum]UAB97393.1 hypothetical protein Dvina_04230 [Dactylosporangium vinaceum]
MLLVLMTSPNRIVQIDDIKRAVWGMTDVQPVQLHKQVAHNRKLLLAAGRDDIKTYNNVGYELRVEARDHDLLWFQHLVLEAARDDVKGTSRAVELLREAVRLWPQHSSADVNAFGADLRFKRVRAMTKLCEAEFTLGRYDEVLDDLLPVAEANPTDVRLRFLLMLALYRVGHTAEALMACDRHRAALEQDTNSSTLDPRIRTLAYAISKGDVAAIDKAEGVASTAAASASAPSLVVPRQLPADLTDFVGRSAFIETMTGLLQAHGRTAPAVVVLAGRSGIGKSTLAVHVAHKIRDDYPDGQLYLKLLGPGEQAEEPAEIMAQVLRTFSVPVPDRHEERAAAYRTLFGGRRMLIVLDDCHGEEQIRDLIPGEPGCAVIVTGRRRLTGLTGAHHLAPLPPLAAHEALTLFKQRVRASGIDPDTHPEETARAVALCAGEPYAIAIIAALRGRHDGLGPEELVRRITNERLPSLTYGDRSVDRSIGAGLHDLGPAARRLFHALGLLRLPDFGLWTVSAALGDGTDPYEAVSGLTQLDLLQVDDYGRYRFYDLTREYANRHATYLFPDAGSRERVFDRVYGSLLTMVRRAHGRIHGGDFETVHADLPNLSIPEEFTAAVDRAPMRWLEVERANLRAAVRHAADLGRAGLAWDIAASAHEFYTISGYLDDWQATHLDALRVCRAAGDGRGEAMLIAALGQPAYAAGGRAGVSRAPQLANAVRRFQEHGDRHGEAIARRTLGNALRRSGDRLAAIEQFETAEALYLACGDLVGRWQALRYVGQTHLDGGDPAAALAILRRADAVAATVPSLRVLAQSAYWLGRAYLAANQVESARQQFHRVLATIEDNDVIGRAYSYHALGDTAIAAATSTQDQTADSMRAEAFEHFETARELAQQGADAVLEGRILTSMGEAYAAGGEIGQAGRALIRAEVCFRSGDAVYLEDRARTVRERLGVQG